MDDMKSGTCISKHSHIFVEFHINLKKNLIKF